MSGLIDVSGNRTLTRQAHCNPSWSSDRMFELQQASQCACTITECFFSISSVAIRPTCPPFHVSPDKVTPKETTVVNYGVGRRLWLDPGPVAGWNQAFFGCEESFPAKSGEAQKHFDPFFLFGQLTTVGSCLMRICWSAPVVHNTSERFCSVRRSTT